jgi:diaminopimelate decarboxylase
MHSPETIIPQTPFYQYNLDLLDSTLASATKEAGRHGFQIHYALKANYDSKVLARIRAAGLGMDCVSGNEVTHALEHGFHPGQIVFAGVGKTDPEIETALRNNILSLNIESVEELEVVGVIAARLGIMAPVALRVNPDIEAMTHSHISTGRLENKFGIPVARLQEALDICHIHPWIIFRGLHFHIGSQITSLLPYENLCTTINKIWIDFKLESYGGNMINLGGGLGIDYLDPVKNAIPDFAGFFEVFDKNLDLPKRVIRHFELGRSLVGQCGSLITRVIYVKEGVGKKHVIVDAGMTELIRPALYGASHLIENLTSVAGDEKYDVVGPICESSDCFGKDVVLPVTSRGDLLKIHSCGAYAESMSMNFNLRGMIGKVYLEKKSLLAAKNALLTWN